MKRLALALAVVASLGRPALAATAGGLSVGPAVQDVTVQQDQKESSFDLHLGNSTGVTLPLQLTVVDFGALDDTGGVAFLGASNDLERRYGLASWVTLEKSSLVLSPGDNQPVKVTIHNKDSLAPGGHYGAVLVKVDAGKLDPSNRSLVNLNQEFSALILVKKLGGELYDISLDQWHGNGGIWQVPTLVKARFHDNGNVHVVPKGDVTVIDPIGRVVARGQINPENSRLLPESYRFFPTGIKTVAPVLLPGQYTMQISYGYDNQVVLKNLRQKLFIIDVPALAGLLVLAVGLGWLWTRRQKLGRFAKTVWAKLPKRQRRHIAKPDEQA